MYVCSLIECMCAIVCMQLYWVYVCMLNTKEIYYPELFVLGLAVLASSMCAGLLIS